MASETPNKPDSSGFSSAPAEADQLFRLQVAIADFLFGNARYIGGLVALGLLGTLVWGLWDSWAKSKAEEDFGAIADIDFRMPKVDELARLGLAPMDDPADATRMANVEEGAKRYEAAAAEASGTAAVYGWLKAAEAWQRRGDAEKARLALEKAHALGAGDLPGFTATSAYATALANADRLEEAIGVLRDATTRFDGLLAEEILIQLATVQMAAGKVADARAVAEEFRTRFPDSPRRERIDAAVAEEKGAAPAGAGG